MTKTAKILLLITCCISFGVAYAHPVHVSVINMDIRPNGNIEFSVKLFVDDFQTVLNRHNQTDFILDASTQTEDIKTAVINYIYHNLHLETPQIIAKEQYQLDKIDINKESIWLYFRIDTKAGRQLKVKNTLMCNLFDDQSNLFIISKDGNDMGYRFTNKDTDFVFKL